MIRSCSITLCYWRNLLSIMQMATCCIAMALSALMAHSFHYKQNPQFNKRDYILLFIFINKTSVNYQAILSIRLSVYFYLYLSSSRSYWSTIVYPNCSSQLQALNATLSCPLLVVYPSFLIPVRFFLTSLAWQNNSLHADVS